MPYELYHLFFKRTIAASKGKGKCPTKFIQLLRAMPGLEPMVITSTQTTSFW